MPGTQPGAVQSAASSDLLRPVYGLTKCTYQPDDAEIQVTFYALYNSIPFTEMQSTEREKKLAL